MPDRSAHLETLAITVQQSLGTVDGAVPARRYKHLQVGRCQQHNAVLYIYIYKH